MIEGQTELMEEVFSLEIRDSGGAQKSRLCPFSDVTSFPSEAYDNVETAWEILERGCRLFGNNRCFGWRNSSAYHWVTYNEFKKRAQDFGCGLINIGMTLGQKTYVGIYGKNSIEWLVAEYGCFSQSVAILSIYDTFGLEATVKMIKQTELEIIICGDESKAQNILQKVAEIPTLRHIIVMHDITEELRQISASKNIRLYSFGDIEELGKEKPVPLSPPAASDIYMVCFTSGTTGEPKGAELTHKYFVCSAYSILMLFESEGVTLSETDVIISYLPLAHIFEHLAEVPILLVGGSIGFYGGNINTLVEDMKTLQPTFFPAVPRLLNKLYDKAQELFHPARKPMPNILLQLENMDLSKSSPEIELDPEIYKPFKNMLGGKIRIVVSGSAQISEKVLNFYKFGLGYKVLEVYGQTECGPISMSLVKKETIGTVGGPLPNCIVKLMDVPEMGYFAKNKKGEICVKGHTVFKGYLKNPQKIAEVIDSDGWLHTGDIGCFLKNGTLKVIDRMRNIFKLSLGEYIAPEKIEAIYSRSPFVSQVLVYGDSIKDHIVSIVVPEQDALLPWVKENLTSETWNEACKNPILKKLILNDMNRLGKEAGLCSFEQAKAVHLHPVLLTYETGHLTPTFKTRRSVCKDFFKSEIESMYKATDATKI